VYNETFEMWTEGGPTCAKESLLGFKYMINLIVLPVHMIAAYYGSRYIARFHQRKLDYLRKSGRGIYPSFLEYA
jgi:hypothetical protein